MCIRDRWVFRSKNLQHHVRPNRQFGETVRALTGENLDACLLDWRESCFCNIADIEMIKLGKWYLPLGQLIHKTSRQKPKVVVKTGYYSELGYSLVNNWTYQI